jgi:hypothetical protein
MEKEQKLLEELIIEKQKYIEKLKIKKEESEFNRQQQFIIDKIRDYIKIDITNEEISSIVNEYKSDINHLKYYFKVTDDDLLIVRKFYNRFARHHHIRYEDSYDIILNYLNKIKILNDYTQHQMQNQSRKRLDDSRSKLEYVKFIPIFC